MYSFYYVEGISETDSPLFNSLAEQSQWFNKHVVKSVDDYYPPNYTNAIRVDSDDLTILSKCNYFSLTYNDKTYYYFITGVEYINEAVVNINVEMDTIQTYMFDIKYNNARISRRSIKRWNDDGSINRNYIRENFGNSNFILKQYQSNVLDLITYGWVVVEKTPKDITFGDIVLDSDYYGRLKMVNSATFRILMPFVYIQASINNGVTTIKVNDETYTYQQYMQKVNGVKSDANAIYSYFIPYNIFDNVTFNYDRETKTLSVVCKEKQTTGSYLTYLGDCQFGLLYSDSLGVMFENKDINKSYSFDFVKNATLGNNFNRNYIPQLLDENYINFSYGYRYNLVEYPISRLTKPSINLYYSVDIISGDTIFLINDFINSEDYYLVANIADSIPDNLFNDIWKSYKASNSTGIYLKPLLSLVGGSSPYVKTTNTENEKYNYSKKSPKRITSIKKTLTSKTQLGGLGDIADTAGILSSYYDMQNAPIQVKQNSNVSSGYKANNYDIVTIYTEVSNLDAVATIYESIGYAQDEFVTGSPIFKDRQIYNYIACSDIDLHLNVLTTSEIVDNIFNRYYNGIRYWNVSTMEQLNLHLGEVCVYDNVEVTGNE